MARIGRHLEGGESGWTNYFYSGTPARRIRATRVAHIKMIEIGEIERFLLERGNISIIIMQVPEGKQVFFDKNVDLTRDLQQLAG
jgi:hypothetical protein